MLKNALLINWIETKSYLRDRTALFWTFIYPVLLLVILDYMFNGNASSAAEKSKYSAFLISGMASMAIVTTALFGFAVMLVSLRHEGKLKLYEVLPIKKVSYLIGFALSRILVMVIFALLFVVLADIFYGSTLQFTVKSVLNFVFLTLIGSFSFISVGFVLVSFISKPTTATALINIISIPILFLSDLFIPINLLPDYIQSVAVQSPVYIFTDASRSILNDGASFIDVWKEMSMLVFIGIVSLLISMKTFKWSPAVS